MNKTYTIVIGLALSIVAMIFGGLFSRPATAQTTSSLSSTATIVAFGDSLVYGTGSTQGHDFVSVLSSRIGHPIINAGLPGDRTYMSLIRLDQDVLSFHPNIVIVFLGGNDILQGVPISQITDNLRVIIRRIQATGAKVILVGIHGQVFNVDYETAYRNLATEMGTYYVPNALNGILGDSRYLSDTVHPNDAGYAIIADRVYPVLQIAINATPGQGLSVTCSPNTSNIQPGREITWTAYAVGGAGNYTYQWSGSQNLSGTGSSVPITYTTGGPKTASVTVTSGGQQVTAQCGSGGQPGAVNVSATEAQVTGYCSVNVSSAYSLPYSISWNSFIASDKPGTTTAYSWTGTEGLASQYSSATQYYNSAGLKTATMNGTAGGRSVSLMCSADVHSAVGRSGGSPPLAGACSPSVYGMQITWTASGSAGMQPVTFAWSGIEGNSASSTTETMPNTSTVVAIYGTPGLKTGTVRIQSADEYLVLSCQAIIASTTQNTGGCFIATAAFGTDMQPEVVVLRNFRDQSLLHNPLGKLFVKIYYAVSPPIADYIRDKAALRFSVRLVLRPWIYVLKHAGYSERVLVSA